MFAGSKARIQVKRSLNSGSEAMGSARRSSHSLRIGNKVMYQDLVNLGVTPKKAKRISIPSVPEQYFKFFVRGYFDGDGCINIYKPKNRRAIDYLSYLLAAATAF